LKVPIKITFYVFLFSLNLFSQEDVKAELVSKKADNLFNITAIGKNIDNTYKEGYSYLLFSLKKDNKGKLSKNSQSGNFSIDPKENRVLSLLKISIHEGEEFKIYLFIRKEDKLISKDSMIVSTIKKNQESDFIEESSIEIRGLVIEDVKTKLGRDFYDYLYQRYMNSGSKYPFIINILENPSIGRGSKITITIDDRNIFEFITRPNDEYIQNASLQAMRYIQNYASQRKLIYRTKRI